MMTKHEQLAAEHYDFYKEIHGIRPRWMNYEEMSVEELEAELESLAVDAKRVFDEREAAALKAVEEFKARVNKCIEMGAGDEQTAIRWLLDGEEDVEHFIWEQGILFTPYGAKLVKQFSLI